MLNFCTLFDSSYLSKGLVLYQSLEKNSNDFHLYIVAFDDISYEILLKMKLKYATIISVTEIETKELLNIKSTRSVGEYCWTCKGPSIKYCFDNFNLDHCTYIDSDLYFFNDPELLFEELGQNDVMLTDHRFTKEYDFSNTNGKYCAGFMYFRNSENGINILNWWIDLCLEWCYSKHEEGRFGDQKYLDLFEKNYANVCDLKFLGGGVAPWNIQQYQFYNIDGELFGKTINGNIQFKVVFYHFHFLRNSKMRFLYEFFIGPYLFSNSDIKLIYRPYINELLITMETLKLTFDNYKQNKIVNEIPVSSFRLFGHIVKNFFRRNKLFYYTF